MGDCCPSFCPFPGVFKGVFRGCRVVDFTYENGALTFTGGDMAVRLEAQADGCFRLTVTRDGPGRHPNPAKHGSPGPGYGRG